MPYEISFSKTVQVQDPESYFNPCCYGGDVVSEQLLPVISEHYADIQANQEDWGWFIWFRDGPVSLAVDIFCDDPEAGTFRIHITSRKKRWFVASYIIDTPELEKLKGLLLARLLEWVGATPSFERLDEKYDPMGAS